MQSKAPLQPKAAAPKHEVFLEEDFRRVCQRGAQLFSLPQMHSALGYLEGTGDVSDRDISLLRSVWDAWKSLQYKGNGSAPINSGVGRSDLDAWEPLEQRLQRIEQYQNVKHENELAELRFPGYSPSHRELLEG